MMPRVFTRTILVTGALASLLWAGSGVALAGGSGTSNDGSSASSSEPAPITVIGVGRLPDGRFYIEYSDGVIELL